MAVFQEFLPWALASVLAVMFALTRHRLGEARRQQIRAREEFGRTSLTLARIRQAIESASDAIGIGDMESNSVYHNPAHVALFGYTVEELNTVPEGGALFADPVVARAIHAAIRGGYSWAGETEVRTKEGRIVPCFVRADIIRDEQERPVGIFGVFTDITERRRTERQLDEQRQRLEVTLQSIGDAVITTDVEGRIVLMNPVAEHYTGWTQARAAGQPLAAVLHLLDERTRTRRESAVDELLRDPRHARSADAYVLVGPDGVERFIAENAALIRTADGRLAGAVLALRDMTREQQRANEVARAGKLESLGLMAGSIAHDFGNLLTAMVGHLSLAQHTPGLPAEAKVRLDETERAVWRARDVTQQLTTFAKGGTLRKKRIALPPLLREATGFAVHNTPVQVRYRLSEDLWAVEADDSQLVQVINNLAVNAVQAMAGGGTLLVTAENEAPDSRSPLSEERWVRIAVTDTGTGIAPENLAKIFDPFFTTKPKGSGFGLATSYSIVKKHDGHLRVESAVGRGTTFTVLLPAAPEMESGTTTFPFAIPTARQPLGRVLLMDDERAVRESLALMLSLIDYDVVEAVGGDDALQKYGEAQAQGRPFDAVLLDLRVPEGLGGAETAKRLRERDPAFRAIAVSGYADDPVMVDFRAHGFAAALAKPFKMDELRSALHSLIGKRG